MATCRLGKVWEESQSVHPLIGVYLSTWPSQTTFEWGILTEPRGNKWCDMNKYACMKMGCQVCNYMTEVATGCSPEPGETEANKDILGPISPDDHWPRFQQWKKQDAWE